MAVTSGTYHPATHRPLTFRRVALAFPGGADSPRAFLERCLEVIAVREPVVRAWATLNKPAARAAADASTARYRANRPLSAIDGMPVGIKDLLQTRDMPTEMGSHMFKGHHTHTDSAAVLALRQAGAVVLGKTVTTELGMSHPGPTTNPFDPARTPGGSSSGSAAAVGAAMVPAALGTQVVGSIIRPAAFCANAAFKPTFGALNRGERQGLSQGHLGVHAGCLRDMWSVAWEIAQRAGGDPGHPGLFGTATLAIAPPRRLLVMETEGWGTADPAARDAFARVLHQLEASGVALVRRSDSKLLDAFEHAVADSLALCRDLCGFELRWALENLAERFPTGFSASMSTRLALARTMTLEDYRLLLLRREDARRALAALSGLGDALIGLACPGPAPLLGNGGTYSGVAHPTGSPAFNAAASVLGAPAVTVPLIAMDGMPVGVQVVGQPHGDAALCGIARWLVDSVQPVVL